MSMEAEDSPRQKPEFDQDPVPASVPDSDPASASADPEKKVSSKWLLLVPLLLALFIGLCLLGIGWRREVKLDNQCISTMKTFSEVAEKYADNNNGRYPFGPNVLEKIVFAKLRHRRFFICPKSKKSYRWTLRQRHRSDPPHLPLCWENPKTSGHGRFSSTYNVLFVGGRVGKVNRQELLELLVLEGIKDPTIVKPGNKPRPGLKGHSRSRKTTIPGSRANPAGIPGVPGR
jgi:hypothetical protein